MADDDTPPPLFDVMYVYGGRDAGKLQAPAPALAPAPRGIGDNVEPFDASSDLSLLAFGGPGGVGDWCRRRVVDGLTTTALTNQSLKESGAGFWGDMARMGGVVLGGGTSSNTVNVYVDSVAGSDANTGLASGAAKRTIAAIPMADNININLKCGSSWREKLNTSAHSGIWVMNYGTGALPILDCADVIPNSGWTQPNAGTYPLVWQIVLTTSSSIASNFASIWVTSGGVTTRLKFVNGIAAITSGTFTILGSSNGQYTGTSTTFQVNTGTNPNTDGKIYEYAARDFGFSGANAVNVSGIHTRRNAHNNGSFDAGLNATVSGCIFEDGSKHNCYVSPGTVMSDCIAWKWDWQAAERDGFIAIVSHNNGLTGVETTTFNRCQVIGDIPGMSAPQQQTGFYCHTDGAPGSNWGHITYTDCSVLNVQTAFDGTNCLGVTHTRSHVKGCTFAINVPSGPSNNAVNVLIDCWVEESNGIVCNRAVIPAGVTTIDGLRVWQSTGFNHAYVYGDGSGPDYTLRQSALARTAGSTGVVTFVATPHTTVATTINGNVMWGDNSGFGEDLVLINGGALDHNAYGGSNSGFNTTGGGTGTGYLKRDPYLTAAHTAGKESGSIGYNVNPFTNAAGGDFHLTVASGLDPAVFGLQRFPTYQAFNTSPS